MSIIAGTLALILVVAILASAPSLIVFTIRAILALAGLAVLAALSATAGLLAYGVYNLVAAHIADPMVITVALTAAGAIAFIVFDRRRIGR